MSMISGQVDRLRTAAQTYRRLGNHSAESMLLDAADTIWQLRDDLQRANDAVRDAEHDESRAWDRVRKAEDDSAKLREQSERLFDKTLELATENSKLQELCKLCERESDNAKLRESVKRLMAQRDERLARAEAENAKLRELISGLEYCAQGHICDCCPLYDPSGTNHHRCESLERELGIEVD